MLRNGFMMIMNAVILKSSKACVRKNTAGSVLTIKSIKWPE